jgi:hypothetical protein
MHSPPDFRQVPLSIVGTAGLQALTLEALQARVTKISLPRVLLDALHSAVVCVTPFKETASELVAKWGNELVLEGNTVREVHRLLTDAEALRRRVAKSLNEFWQKKDSTFEFSKESDEVLILQVCQSR